MNQVTELQMGSRIDRGPYTSSEALKPIVYSQPMDVRFSDLDPYGHVSTGRYLDLVIASRFLFFTNTFKLTTNDLAKRDLGFFTSHLEIDFVRPISGVQQLLAETTVQIEEPGKQKITFELKRIADGKVFAKGWYFEHPVKLSTGKPQPLPDWAYQYFFQLSKKYSSSVEFMNAQFL